MFRDPIISETLETPRLTLPMFKEIAELILVRGPVSDSDVLRIEAYLTQKHQL